MLASKRIVWALLGLATATLACSLLSKGSEVAQAGEIAVTINSPANNSQVAVGQEVMVQITINDPAGVVNRQELKVDGVAVATSEAVAPPGASAFSIILPYTPTQPGSYTLSAVAYGSDGSVSQSATITLTVTGEAEAEGEEEAGGGEEPPTAEPTATVNPTPVPDERGCTNDMRYVADVTVPDNTVMAPGQPFVKTWTINNAGTCDWGPGYQFVFYSDNQMGGPASVVAPAASAGQNADISVNLTAPSASGTHKGFWTMRAPDGQLFGDKIWVQIVVEAPSVGDKPDLRIVSVTTNPAEPKAGEATQYTIEVKNQGNADAGESTLKGEFETAGTATVTVPALAAGATESVVLTATTPNKGKHKATFTADADGDVDESDEDNNTLSKKFTYVVIYTSGTFTVRGTYHGDLDEGQESAGTTDFWWEMVTSSERYLQPENGATFAVMGSEAVGYKECSSASLGSGAIDASDPDYSDMPVGSWLCAETSDGRITAFKIADIDASANHEMTINFTTYE